MYESFYGMKERPFALTPDPAFLFLSANHSIALSMLEYSLMGQAGFTVITGEIGSGKTTLIREFLKRADRTINVGVISNTHIAFGDLLQWVLLAFGIHSETGDKPSRYQTFVRYLMEQYRVGRRTILIVDEAQNLSIEALEELRLLSNVNAEKDQLLQMILMGQPELFENLRRQELRQFVQRISVHYHLAPLTYTETRGYILHRLHVAGADSNLFDSYAIGAIFYFAGGIPRLINSICDMALVYGFAAGRRTISIDIILLVVRDKEKGGLLLLPKPSGKISREALIAETQRAFGEEDYSLAAGQSEMGGTPNERPKTSVTAPSPDLSEAIPESAPYAAQETQAVRAGDGPDVRSDGRLTRPIVPSYLEQERSPTRTYAPTKRGRRLRWMPWLP